MMKVAVTSQGPDLDSPMDPRFGRCPYLLIVEADDLRFEAVSNPYVEEPGGAGGRLAGLVAQRGVEAVITGDCGPHARDALQAAGVCLVTLSAATPRQAVEQQRAKAASAPADGPDQSVEASPMVVEHVAGGRGRSRRGGGGQGRQRRRRRCERRNP